jgi:hypothetical protein
MSTWVLKRIDGMYLAPTVYSKFSHVTMGDIVPEQLYACRYYSRNDAAAMVVKLRSPGDAVWRIVRLRPRAPLQSGLGAGGSSDEK